MRTLTPVARACSLVSFLISVASLYTPVAVARIIVLSL